MGCRAPQTSSHLTFGPPRPTQGRGIQHSIVIVARKVFNRTIYLTYLNMLVSICGLKVWLKAYMVWHIVLMARRGFPDCLHKGPPGQKTRISSRKIDAGMPRCGVSLIDRVIAAPLPAAKALMQHGPPHPAPRI